MVDSAGDGYLRAGGAFATATARRADGFAVSREVSGPRRRLHDPPGCVGGSGGFDERFFSRSEDVDLSYAPGCAAFACGHAADDRAARGQRLARNGEPGLRVLQPAELRVDADQEHAPAADPGHVPCRTRSIQLRVCCTYVPGALAAAASAKGRRQGAAPPCWRDRRRCSNPHSPGLDLERLMEPRWLAAKRREKAFASSRRILRRSHGLARRSLQHEDHRGLIVFVSL